LIFDDMNILAFGLALGIINVFFFVKNKKEILIIDKPELWIGFAFVLFFYY